MATGRKIIKKTPTPEEIQLFASTQTGVYIDPKTDFGFKRLFGDSELMKDFLNSVLGISIVDLKYGNPVKISASAEERIAIFDLFCTTRKNEQIIVEMQVLPSEYYKDRTVFYASRAIQNQARRGKWDFKLCPVYLVSIVDFCMDKNTKNADYASRIQLFNPKTKKVFYDKLTLVYLELPRFNKTEAELTTNEEKWMYALKYLPVLSELPKKLKIKIFEKLFELAKIAKMTKGDQHNYYKSLYDMSLFEIEFGKMEKTITLLTKENAAKDVRIAELERRLGLRGATAAKPSRTTKVRARNSAKARAAANKW